MIFDSIDNILKYNLLNKNFDAAIGFIKETNFDLLSNGKHSIKGEDIYAMVNRYETKHVDEVEWEIHKKYIDIQILIEGEETMGYSQPNTLHASTGYNAEKDIQFFKGDRGDYVALKKGLFIIFFPGEAHRPGLISIEKSQVKKLVIKVMNQ
jgi:biofilm protein TabA